MQKREGEAWEKYEKSAGRAWEKRGQSYKANREKEGRGIGKPAGSHRTPNPDRIVNYFYL